MNPLPDPTVPAPTPRDLFLAAVEIGPPPERAAFLDCACQGDDPLRAAVEDLLAHHRDDSFLEDPAVEIPTICAASEERPGEQIDRYRLLQKIGEGGFGTVWMAEQTEPVSRRVALKIIKLGMDSREVLARFEAERQALAMMDHPNIAKVLDAGTAASGRPFFAMELVKGIPITQFCDEKQFGTRERLQLFGDVCAAINHAHQKGIIHRDIKPSNVMVTLHGDKPVVKVIDFGIAKATQGKLTDKTLFTRFEQFIGTPVYMSPEQAVLSGLDIDTRSDIYALGILLYELLTGKPPFDAKSLASAGYDEMRRIIREVEPPKPSSRLSTLAGDERTSLAKARHIEPEKLDRLVEPDLDWIVMKAIEKDRARRYETANGLAQDIGRFLADEPVSATPPSAGYRFRKFARRHRVAFRVGAGIAATLVVATVVSSWLAVRAIEAGKAARLSEGEARRAMGKAQAAAAAEASAKTLAEQRATEAAEAQADTAAFAEFLSNHVLAACRPQGVQGGVGVNVTLAEALASAEAAIPEVFAGRPLAEALAHQEIGVTWRNLGRFAAAEQHLRKALSLRAEHLGAGAADTVDSRNSLAVTLGQMELNGEALRLHEEDLKLLDENPGLDPSIRIGVCANLGQLLGHIGRADEGVRLLEEALAASQAAQARPPGGPSDELLRSFLAGVYADAGRWEDAERLYLASLQQLAQSRPEDDWEILTVRQNFARGLADDYPAESLQILEEILPILEGKLGSDHPDFLGAKHVEAIAMVALGRLREAEEILQVVLPAMDRRLGRDHRLTLETSASLGRILSGLGRGQESLALTEERAALSAKVYGADDFLTVRLRCVLAVAMGNVERNQETIRIYQDIIRISEAQGWEGTWFWPTALGNLSEAYGAAGQGGEAERLARRAIDSLERHQHPADSLLSLQTRAHLASAYAAQDRYAEAAGLLQEILPTCVSQAGISDDFTLTVRGNLAVFLHHQGERAQATQMHKENLEAAEGRWGAASPGTIIFRRNLADSLRHAGEIAAAAELTEENLAICEREFGREHRETFDSRTEMAVIDWDKEDWEEAESLWRQNLEMAPKLFPEEPGKELAVMASLGFVLLQQQKWTEAEQLLRKCVAGRRQLEPDKWTTFNAISQLGEALLGQQQLAAAAPLLAEGYAGMLARPQAGNRDYARHLRHSIGRLVRLCEATDKPAEAAEWRSKLAAEESVEQP